MCKYCNKALPAYWNVCKLCAAKNWAYYLEQNLADTRRKLADAHARQRSSWADGYGAGLKAQTIDDRLDKLEADFKQLKRALAVMVEPRLKYV